MRYHYKKPAFYGTLYGETYECAHPVYRRCTLFRTEEKGLAVIQQRWDPATRHTWWSEIDRCTPIPPFPDILPNGRLRRRMAFTPP